MRTAFAALVLATAAFPPMPAAAQDSAALAGSEAREILARTETIRLAPDLAHLSPGERAALDRLLEVGAIFQAIYEDQRHAAALAARARLAPGTEEATLYRLFNGPIATTLDNRRVPFLGVADAPPGKNLYPPDLTDAEYEAFLAAHPDRREELTHLRSVVRRADAANLARDIAALRRHPVLDALHPGLLARLEAL
ncbi:MAG TPA: hypothetical protein VI168_04470, partial [Croceibacterium sp.]